jgi:phage tail-like protein
MAVSAAAAFAFSNYLLSQITYGSFTYITGCQDITSLPTQGAPGSGIPVPGMLAGRPFLPKRTTIVLKRGLISSSVLLAWIKASQASGSAPQQSLRVQLQNPPGTIVGTWALTAVALESWTGPALNSTAPVATFDLLTLSAGAVTYQG